MATLVIGGAGFIGSHLVDELLVGGSEVTVADDLSTGKLENLSRWKGNDKLDFVKIDASDPTTMKRLVDHKNWVFNFAPGIDTTELADLCCWAEVKHLVLNAEDSVGGLWEQKMPVTVLQYEKVYGPRGPKDGEIFVSDIVRANIMSAMNQHFDGNAKLTLEGQEFLGWKPLVDQGQGKYIIEMYEKVNTSLIILATR